ncbi:hypothetical protein [Paludisphaera mucosa]|uniref:Uncharacterized protein n=1 Tax=Paludisphaera mucosa TaxID=3030827 RepID=A0ABT6FJA5_9BACT|nr:hypothetical protein [Paludisphaera mucosa]MDG3007662.1 hypothetical protein [Paludisphaera mucosa]
MSRTILSSRRAHLAIAACSALLTILTTAVLQGCGGAEPVFDQSVKHTPETLAQEFVTRYKNLPANRKPLKSARSAATKGEAPEQDESAKSSRKEAVVKSEMLKESETLENIVATLEERLGKLEGVPRAEAAKKAAAVIEQEPAVKAEDKAAVLERLKKLD